MRLVPAANTPFRLLAGALVSAVLSACGGGGDSSSDSSTSAGTVTPSLTGAKFVGFMNGSHRDAAGDSFTIDGKFDVTVNDAQGTTTGTATLEGVSYPVVGTISPSTKQVELAVPTSTTPKGPVGGVISGKVTDQTGFWGMASTFEIMLPVSGRSTTGRYSGNLSADTTASGAGATAGGGGSGAAGGAGGDLVGTWGFSAGGQRAVEILSGSASGGTGKARTWSGAIDGAYIEYTWSVSGSTKNTAVTKYLACDFNRGTWLAQPERPTGSVTFKLSGDTVTYSNAPNTPYTRGSSTLSVPTAGSNCSKL